MTGTLLSFGHGYTARRLARLLLPLGWRIIGTTRTEERAVELAKEGVEALVWPGTDLHEAIMSSTHVLLSAPPDDGRDPLLASTDCHSLLEREGLRWVGYLSTTGVYGDHGGDWVDESTPVNPSTERGKTRVRMERAWRSGLLPMHVFRLAGIYGPGRGPFKKVLAGTARRVIKPDQVFSRIHVDDAARVLKASMERPDPGAIYNVCDDLPAPPEEVIAHAAELLGVPVPPAIPFDEAEMSPMARSFYADSKRVSNRKIKAELGVELEYPDYRSGLAALLAQARGD